MSLNALFFLLQKVIIHPNKEIKRKEEIKGQIDLLRHTLVPIFA